MEKLIIGLLSLLATSFSLCAQNGTLYSNNNESSPVHCFVIAIDGDNVYYTIEGSDEKQTIKIEDIAEIVFPEGTYTFDEGKKVILKKSSNYLPKSKYEVINVGTGKYTLHGKPYKGPVVVTYNGYAYAGEDFYKATGILVKIK